MRAKDSLVSLLLVVISFLLSLVLLEGVLHISNYPPRKIPRFLFFSRPALQDQKTAFGFHGHTKIREVAVYKPGKEFQVEYDTTYKTNNLGLVQKTDFDPRKESLVFIGDSFTQGEGASPWFYKFEESWGSNEYQLVNLGLMGTGLVQWADTLQWFSGISKIKHVFILFISDDWLRRRWYAHDNLEGTSFLLCTDCPKNNGVCKNIKNLGIVYIDKDWDIPAILKKAGELPGPRVKPGFSGFWNDLYFRQLFRALVPSTRNRPHLQKLINNSRDALDRIIALFGSENLTVLHLPLREEVNQGAYTWAGRQARDLVLARRVAYLDGLALCGLTGKDFHEYDNHPNALGYAKILTCLRTQALRNYSQYLGH